MEQVSPAVQNFEGLMVRLHAAGLDFVIIGGVCASYHGSSLATFDLDISCEFSEVNLHKIMAALTGLDPVHRLTPQRLPFELTPELCARLKNLYLQTNLGKLDCLGEVAGIGSFQQVFEHSSAAILFGKTFRFLTLDALILAKKAADRDWDRRAIGQLEAIKEALSKQKRPQEN